MHKFNLFLCAAVALIITGCATSASSIITDYDQEVSFNQYKTYYWANEFEKNSDKSDTPLFYNSLIQKRLKNDIQGVMKQRGYTLNENNPDLLVNVNVQVQPNQEVKTSSSAYPVGYSPFYPGFGQSFGYYYGFYSTQNSTSVSTHMEGGLVIELIDRAKRQLVWQGYAPDVLHTDTKDKRKELQDAVDQIFSRYDKRFKE